MEQRKTETTPFITDRRARAFFTDPSLALKCQHRAEGN